MERHDPTHQRQPDTQPAIGPVECRGRLRKQREQTRHHVCGNPDAVVADGHGDFLPVMNRSQLDMSVRIRVLGCVDQKIGEYLGQAYGVCFEAYGRFWKIERQGVMLCIQHGPSRLDRDPNHQGQFDGAFLQLELPARNSRNIEEIVQETAHMGNLPLDDLLRTFLTLGGSAGLFVSRKRISNGSKGVAQLVGEERQELILAAIRVAQGFFALAQYLLHPASPIFALAQGLFGSLAFGDVAGNLGGTDDDAARVSDRRHRERDGDARAILGETYGVEMVDAIAASQPLQYARLLLMKFRRNHDGDRLPDGFCARVPRICARHPRSRTESGRRLSCDARLVRRSHDCSQNCRWSNPAPRPNGQSPHSSPFLPAGFRMSLQQVPPSGDSPFCSRKAWESRHPGRRGHTVNTTVGL